MCQLTLISSTSNVDLRPFISLLLPSNNLEYNKDGWGMYSPTLDLLYKNKEVPTKDPNFITNISRLPRFTTTLFHVRAASTVNRDTYDSKHNHPFDKKNIVLAHNGTLTRKLGEKPKDIIDSEDFANELDNLLETEPDMYKALSSLYKEKYKGKFAFLIYYKKEKTFYVARGNTADLNIVHITIKSGNIDKKITIINTLPQGVQFACNVLSNVYCSTGQAREPFDVVISELKKNTVYRFDEKLQDVVELGELREEDPTVYYQANQNFFPKSTTNTGTNTTNKSKEDNKVVYGEEESVLYGLGQIFGKSDITYEELCYMIEIITRKPITSMDAYVQTLSMLTKLAAYCTTGKTKVWREIKRLFADKKMGSTMDIYVKYSIQFPYFVNTNADLKRLRNHVQKEKRIQ